MAYTSVQLDVLGEPTGPYKVQWVGDRIFIAQGWQDVGAAR